MRYFNIPIATGTRVNKKLRWVHDASNFEYIYLDIRPKRGFKGMGQRGVPTEFSGFSMQSAFLSETSRFRLITSFRTEDGARDYLKIMSYIGTAHKHGINAFEAIREALNGNPDIIST